MYHGRLRLQGTLRAVRPVGTTYLERYSVEHSPRRVTIHQQPPKRVKGGDGRGLRETDLIATVGSHKVPQWSDSCLTGVCMRGERSNTDGQVVAPSPKLL